jgi:hypothetical protein
LTAKAETPADKTAKTFTRAENFILALDFSVKEFSSVFEMNLTNLFSRDGLTDDLTIFILPGLS